MGDFKLQVDVEAETSKLENGLTNVERKADQAGKKISESMDGASESMDNAGVSGEDLLAKIGKVAAGLFILEGAFKLATVAASDNDEQVRAMLTSLPVVGPLVTAILDFTDALAENDAMAQKARASLLELELATKQLASTIASTTSALAAEAEMLKLSGLEDHEIVVQQYEQRKQLIRDELEAKIQSINEEYSARQQQVLDANLAYEEEERLLIRLRNEKYAARDAAREEAAMREAALSMTKQQAHMEAERRVEAEKAAEAAARKAEIDASAEEHHRQIQEIEEKRKKEEAERLKAAEAARKEEEKFLAKKTKMEEEIAKARVAAQAAVQGATATFSTAGGSFTTAVSAQVNEAKLLNKISQQSRDFLAQIVTNTARMGLGFA